MGVATATRSELLLFVALLVVTTFALGVGAGVALATTTRSELLLFVALLVVTTFALGLGVGVGLCCLYIFDLLLLRLVAFGFGVGVGCPALAAPMLPARVIAVIANVFSSVFRIFILPTTKSIAGRALLFLSFCARILCRSGITAS